MEQSDQKFNTDSNPAKSFGERLSDRITDTENKLEALKILQRHLQKDPSFVEALKALALVGFY